MFILESYVEDDMFGGAQTKKQAAELMRQLILTGKITTAEINFSKCHGPSRVLVILGIEFDSILEKCKVAPKNRTKYIRKLLKTLETCRVTSKDLEKTVGYLVYASWAEPFGRPFISALSSAIDRIKH